VTLIFSNRSPETTLSALRSFSLSGYEHVAPSADCINRSSMLNNMLNNPISNSLPQRIRRSRIIAKQLRKF